MMLDRLRSPRTRPQRPRSVRRLLELDPLEPRLVLSTLTVTSLADSGAGSLREAIVQANTSPDDDTIRFAPTVVGQITLQSALPDLSSNLTLIGPGSSVLGVARDSGASTPDFRIFSVTASASVSISGLTISGGRTSAIGGGILNQGTLTVADSVIRDNQTGSLGGGIENTGTLTVARSQIRDNRVESGGGGGLDNNAGTVNIADCEITGNVVRGQYSAGGGISNSAPVGFGPEKFATMFIANSLISENSAPDANGGGITSGGKARLTLTGCTISQNSAGLLGGGISGGGLTVTNSTIAGNSAAYGGGGLYIAGDATVTFSTIAGNSANLALEGGATVSGQLTIQATLFENPVGGNLGIFPVVGIPPGQVFSLGHNLFSDDPDVTLDPTDIINTDPRLAPLADNGGPTPTMALRPGSPAIDAAVLVAGVATDQRGVGRPQGFAPDIGAFESQVVGAVLLVGGNDQSAETGAKFDQPLSVKVIDLFGDPISGVLVTFTTPSSGASAVLNATSVSTGADGTAQAIATANDVTGTYSVPTAVEGVAGPTFLLTNLPLPIPPPSLPPPTVLTLQRLGVHVQPTTIVVQFSGAMDATRAGNPGNYQLAWVGRDGKPGTRDDRMIRLRSVRYDPATQTVWIAPAQRLPLRSTYQLTVNGSPPDGLTSTRGIYLGGAGIDRPGTNYVATFGRDALTQDRLLHPSRREYANHPRQAILHPRRTRPK